MSKRRQIVAFVEWDELMRVLESIVRNEPAREFALADVAFLRRMADTVEEKLEDARREPTNFQLEGAGDALIEEVKRIAREQAERNRRCFR